MRLSWFLVLSGCIPCRIMNKESRFYKEAKLRETGREDADGELFESG